MSVEVSDSLYFVHLVLTLSLISFVTGPERCSFRYKEIPKICYAKKSVINIVSKKKTEQYGIWTENYIRMNQFEQDK